LLLSQEPGCTGVNLLLVDPPADALWRPGREVYLAARSTTASCAGAQAGSAQGPAYKVQHQLLTPNGVIVSSGASSVTVGQNYTWTIPSNASGATLLNVTANSLDGTTVAKSTYRMLIGAPAAPRKSSSSSSSSRRSSSGGGGSESGSSDFAFCSTLEWHVQAALLGSGLLEKQLVAERALGGLPAQNAFFVEFSLCLSEPALVT
jgi:hypothetical protein